MTGKMSPILIAFSHEWETFRNPGLWKENDVYVAHSGVRCCLK